MVSALSLAACGSDGPSALSAKDLSSEMDSLCRAATRAIDKLDDSDAGDFFDGSIDELTAAGDGLEALTPGEDVKDDFDDFASSISKQVKQAKKVATAVKNGDAGAIATAMEKFTEYTTDSDDLADGLDATKCIGLGAAAVAPAGTSVATTPPTTVPETVVETTTTIADTLPPTTVPTPTTVIATLPTITTAPPTVPPPTTVAAGPDGGTADGNMIDQWVAPPGFEFDRASGDIFVPIFDSPRAVALIAPNYVRYDVGALGGPNATTFPIMMALELTDKFTDDQIDAYITFEGNDAGSTVDSPGGYKMWVVPAAGDITFDATMLFLGKYAITIRTDPGVDSLGLLDAFIVANFE